MPTQFTWRIDGDYQRLLVDGVESPPPFTNEFGQTVYPDRHIFSGPTLVMVGASDYDPTYDFAGLAFATPSGAPYDSVEQLLEIVPGVGVGTGYSRPIYLSYELADGSVYYHQQYTYAGTRPYVQGYIASETVHGSYFDTFFYKSRIDNYDAGGKLVNQYYQDGNGANLMFSEYVYNLTPEPWAKVEIDYLPDAQGQMRLAHHIYTAADGSIYVDAVYRSVNGNFESYTTGSAVTAGGYALRVDRSDFQPFVPPLVQQQFFDSDNILQLTIDNGYIGSHYSILWTKTHYGAALDDAPYEQIVDHYVGIAYGVWKRVYDMRDGSHTIEMVQGGNSHVGTSLGPGVVNADDTYALYAHETVYFQGRFGTDTLYNFLYATDGSGPGAKLNFETSQFPNLAAVRAAATSGGGADITITNAFGDKVVLKSVLVDGATIDDVLNSFSVTFSQSASSGMAQFADAKLSSNQSADSAGAATFVAALANADAMAAFFQPLGQHLPSQTDYLI